MAPALEVLQQDLRAMPEYLLYEMLDQLRYQFRRRMAEMPGGAWTQARLAQEMGVSAPVVNRMLRADQNVSLLTVAKAARALRLSVCAFKLVPDEQRDTQVSEFQALVKRETEGADWWPRTRRHLAPSAVETQKSATLETRPQPAKAPSAAAFPSANDYAYAVPLGRAMAPEMSDLAAS